MPDFSLPDFSLKDRTWTAIGNVAMSTGNFVMGERYADGEDVYTLTYAVVLFDLNGVVLTSKVFDQGRTRENRADARAHFLARVSDSIWS